MYPFLEDGQDRAAGGTCGSGGTVRRAARRSPRPADHAAQGLHRTALARRPASLVPPPPWHYSGDFLIVEYRTDPAAVAALLPPELEPAAEDPGAVAAIFADWQSCSDDLHELVDPVRASTRSSSSSSVRRIRGQPVSRCVYIWVDKDFAMYRGWIQGFPKKLGSIHMTRMFPVGRAAPHGMAPGARFGATCAANDRQVARAVVTLARRVGDRPDRQRPADAQHPPLPGLRRRRPRRGRARPRGRDRPRRHGGLGGRAPSCGSTTTRSRTCRRSRRTRCSRASASPSGTRSRRRGRRPARQGGDAAVRHARIEVDGQAVEGTVDGDVITLPDGARWRPPARSGCPRSPRRRRSWRPT